MRRQFKDTILDLTVNDPDIVMIFGDVSVYLFQEFQRLYPDRFYNMGICENTLISVGAGLSSMGFRPFIHTIAPFITERSYEQIKLDLCYNRFPANIVSCGATFDYAWDGATHHCYTDLAILRLLPEMEVLQPGSEKELDRLIRHCYRNDKTTYYRLSDHPHGVDIDIEPGKGVVLMDRGAPVTVVTAGPLLGEVMPAVVDLDVNLVYLHALKPMDKEVIRRYRNTRLLVVEDALGIAEAIDAIEGVRVVKLGLEDRFYDWYGTLKQIREKAGLDAASIRLFVQDHLRETEA